MFPISQEDLIGAEDCTLLADEVSAVTQPASIKNIDLITKIIGEVSTCVISQSLA